MRAASTRFTVLSRLLHWSSAVMVIAQFFIGVTMIAALSYYPLLLAIHRPLGIAILVFTAVRLVNRLTHKLPPFLATMGPVERRVSSYSEYLLYALLLLQPLIGWAMLSAAQSPVVLVGAIHLPAIAPHNLTLYAVLRTCHSVAAYLLFAAFTAHILAVLFHTLVLRDGIIDRMALWPKRSRAAERSAP
ncbi:MULTISPECIES: cytochrome b [Mycolicibacterium]|uniref:cytochrome b n=1 Tax=Mycolicibacterium TaxID=1866885 RepID=UPI0011D31582|nr:cytochrome b/b6 domain-containing protein [Mycolicibacterium mageritense]TXI62696.1 MAG: cytochrome b [Mycolicibacterium mageritense]